MKKIGLTLTLTEQGSASSSSLWGLKQAGDINSSANFVLCNGNPDRPINSLLISESKFPHNPSTWNSKFN